MKKYLLSGLVVFAFIAYALHYQVESSQPVIAPATIPVAAPITTPTPLPVPPAPPTPTISTKGKYKDGQYTGISADAYYGNIQVKVIISGGKITDVKFLDYPQDRQNSIRINSEAMPLLTQEAIAAQSASVDTISGATATSDAFVQSLQSALNQAS